MRRVFTNFCLESASNHMNFQLLTADLGYGMFDDYRSSFPDNFINVGVAEQNLIGIATGMALSGIYPVCYSIGNFPTLRCLEQIRNDAAYHNASIIIVSSGGGFGYGQLGMSHHATEDIGIMSVLPNVEIYAPATPAEAALILPHIYNRGGVKYLRLEKTGDDYQHLNNNPLEDGFFQYREGSDGLVLALGTTLNEAMDAADKLSKLGIQISVCSLAVVKSSDKNIHLNLRILLKKYKVVVTIEEHNDLGGIGSRVCDIVATSGIKTKVTKIGMKDCYSSIVGDQIFLRNEYNINSENIMRVFGAKL